MINVVKTKVSVVGIISHSDGVFTVELKPEKKMPRFKSGQFLHLALDEYDAHGGFWPDSRVFSIASGCEEETITLVYSVKGSFTSRMSKELFIGKQLWIKLPFGDFTIERSEQEDLILLAGGTGVAPFIPYLQDELHASSGRKILFVYGVRKSGHILFSPVLNEALMHLPNFDLMIFNELGDADEIKFFKKINSDNGYIDNQKVFEKSCAMRNPLFFISGPPTMIRATKQHLVANGVKEDRIKIDNW